MTSHEVAAQFPWPSLITGNWLGFSFQFPKRLLSLGNFSRVSVSERLASADKSTWVSLKCATKKSLLQASNLIGIASVHVCSDPRRKLPQGLDSLST
jgi:hypothetical protein